MSSLFPPGYGPCTEAVKQAADLEASVLDNLTLAVSHLRKGFVDLGMKQDVICREHERAAAHAGGVPEKVDFPNETVLGQSAADAEVCFFSFSSISLHFFIWHREAEALYIVCMNFYHLLQ
jgi:hypothetical protein